MGKWRFSKYYFWLALLLTLLSLDHARAAVVTIDESFTTRLLGRDFEFHEDATGLLDFEAVRQQAFQPNPFLVPAFGYAKSTYWYRFELRNATDVERQLFLELAIAWIDHFSLFMQKDGRWVRYDAGVATPVGKRSAQNNVPTHKIDLPAQSQTNLYLRIASSDTIVLPIHLHSAAYFASHIRIKDLLYGLFAGIMAVAAFYGLAFYVYTFNQAYLYYFLNTLSWLAMFAAWDGYGQEFIFHDDFWWNKRFNVLVMASSLAFGALFTLKILEIPSYSQRLTRIVMGWSAVQAILFISVFILPYSTMMQTASNIALAFPVILCATSFTALRHRMNIARYYLMSWVFPIIGVAIFNGMVVGLIPGEPLFVYALHFGILIQSLFLSFTLSYHLREATRNASVLKVSVEAAGLAHSALMQNDLDPHHFTLAYRYRPCEESGGDVFSCLQDPRGHYSYIVVGDVSGHGITAAIISSAFTGALNATVKGLLSTGLDLEESCTKIMSDLNQVMCDYFARTNHFASAVLVGIDNRNGQAIYLNAGHRNIFLKSGDKVSTLLRGGSLMGFHSASHLTPVPLTLTENDMLLFFTDGLV
ncbi:MAG: SpoIIE family protein phosphatase, partial [Pseudobdellovibrionaceae bacterium]|nr:SpoIIE family protein phosphatase [Pseudobdellovibrionaceae bacterium]